MWNRNRVVAILGWGNSLYKSSANKNFRLVRGKVRACIETFIPYNPSKHQIKEFAFGPQCMEPHAQPVVEIPYGHFRDLLGGGGGAKQAMMAINCASLGQIWVAYTREEAGGFQRDGHDPHGEPPNFEVDSNHGSCAEMRRAPVLQKGRNGHSKIHDDMWCVTKFTI